MLVTAGRMPDGRYRGVFEVVGPQRVPVHLAESPDGLHWGAAEDLGEALEASDGTTLAGTPNISWRVDPFGRTTIVVTGRLSLDRAGNATNRALVNVNGGVGLWQSFELPTPARRALDGDDSGYSQSLVWNTDGRFVHATTVSDSSGALDLVVTVADQPKW
jgi:hypothetical protein